MIAAVRSLIGTSRHAARPGASTPRPSALTAISTRAASNTASMRPCTLGSERLKELSAPASTPRPPSGSAAKIANIPAAASARRNRLGALAAGFRYTKRRASQRSGAAASASAITSAVMPILSASVSRSPAASTQLPIRPRITSPSTGTSRPTAAQSCGLRMLDERAKVRCVNNWRRAALMRVPRSSASSNMARAARRLASSRSCLFFSVSSSLAATSVVGAVSPDLGVSSVSRCVDAARRGVRSATAPCRARASASFCACRRCKPASSTFLSLSDSSVAVSAARVWSRSSRWVSCAQTRPRPMRTKARTIQCNGGNADAGFIAS